MSGIPAFQATPHSFQDNAFQSGVILVAGDYSLGSPSFATPTLLQNFHLSASSYTLGAPDFAQPPLHAFTVLYTLNANPYSLGSPVFVAPFLRSSQRLNAPGYTLGAPTFLSPPLFQVHRLFSNFYTLTGALDFGHVAWRQNYQFTAVGFAVGPLSWPTVGPILVNRMCVVENYSLQSPRFGFPRIGFTVVHIDLPPTYYTQAEQAAQMLRG